MGEDPRARGGDDHEGHAQGDRHAAQRSTRAGREVAQRRCPHGLGGGEVPAEDDGGKRGRALLGEQAAQEGGREGKRPGPAPRGGRGRAPRMDEQAPEDGRGGQEVGASDDVGDRFRGHGMDGEQGRRESGGGVVPQEQARQAPGQHGVGEVQEQVQGVVSGRPRARAEDGVVEHVAQGRQRPVEAADRHRPPVVLREDRAQVARVDGADPRVLEDLRTVVQSEAGREGVGVGESHHEGQRGQHAAGGPAGPRGGRGRGRGGMRGEGAAPAATAHRGASPSALRLTAASHVRRMSALPGRMIVQ